MDVIKMPGKKELMHELRQICPFEGLRPLWSIFGRVAGTQVSYESLHMSWIVAVDEFCMQTKRPDWYRVDLQREFEVVWHTFSDTRLIDKKAS